MGRLVLICALIGCSGNSGTTIDGGTGDAPIGDGGTDGAGAIDARPETCGVGKIQCGTACVDPTDPASCGRCDHDCGAGAACDNGTCITSACAGYALANAQPQSLAGTNPASVAVGDFDGDGKLDVVTTNSFFSAATNVLLGNAAGSFGHLRTYGTTQDTAREFVGDVDGDGKQDIVVNDSSNIYLLLGHGDGTFTRSEISDGHDYLAAADLDGDGRLDLVALGFPQSVDVRYGQAGGFTAVQSYPLPFAANTVAIGDFDGDTKLDIVTNDAQNLNFLKNLGNRMFAVAVASVETNIVVNAMVGGDFTGDGARDLVLELSNGTSYLVAGTGTGTFAAKVAIAVSGNLVAADLDGDHKDDLVAANEIVCQYHATGTGFAAPKCIESPQGSAYQVAAGDVDQDGDPDIVVIDVGLQGVVSVLANVGGSLAGPSVTPFALETSYATLTAADDWNGDGKADQLVAMTTAKAVVVVTGTNRVPTTIATFATTDQAIDAQLVDLDALGTRNDLVIATNAGVEIVPDATTKSSGAATLMIAAANPSQVRTAHFSGGLYPEVAVVQSSHVKVYAATSSAMYNQTPVVDLSLGGNLQIAVGEMTGDTHTDLVTVVAASQVAIHPGTASGTLGPAGTPATVPSGGSDVALADLDLDGKLDVVLDSGWVRNLGGANLGTFTTLLAGADLLGVADWDHDGRPDIFYVQNDMVSLAHNLATGIVIDHVWRIANPRYGKLGDTDGDGHLDLLFAFAGGVHVAYGTATGDLGTPVAALTFVTQAIARGDFDEDGKDDLVLQDSQGQLHPMLARPGGFVAQAAIAGGTAPPLVADVDLDGHVDLIVDGIVYRGDGHGALTPPAVPHEVNGNLTRLGFVDGDSYPDLVVTSQGAGATRVWFGGPNGFTSGPAFDRGSSACVADVDHDGKGDLIEATFTQTLTTAPGNGDGTFGTPVADPAMIVAIGATVACVDLDLDHYADPIATQASETARIATNGETSIVSVTGAFGHQYVTTGFPAGTVDFPRLRGSAARDVVVSNGALEVSTLAGRIISSDLIGGPAVAGDFDGDGVLDIAVAAPSGLVIYRGSCL